MSPDINSLPPSRSTSASPRQRHTPSSSLLDAVASSQATSSAGSSSHATSANPNNNNLSNNSTTTTELARRHHYPVPSERRRSGNLNLNSSSNSYSEPIGDMPLSSDHRSSVGHGLLTSSGSPIIGTGDPHHQRTPSLGELHQELEQEQEAQVNRLLQTIRSQQAQLHQFQQQQQQQSVVDDTAPFPERSTPFPPIAPLTTPGGRTSTQLSSNLSSRRPSQAHSPNLRPLADSFRVPDTLEWIPGPGESSGRRGSRDETSFYQAEVTMLSRENQILRQRIRELERQVNELTTNSSTRGLSATTAAPFQTPDEPNTTGSLAATGAASDGESSDKT